MSDCPRISCVMPVYNADRFLEQAVRSVLGQTFADFELVIVDDGSTDRSSAMLRQFADKDQRVRLIHQENAGIPAANNRALAACRAPMIARLDADDVSHPGRFAAQMAFMDRHPSVVGCGCFVRMIDDRGRRLTDLVLPEDDQTIQSKLLAGHGAIFHSAAMIRREALDRIGGYDNSFPVAQDLDLWLRLGEIGELRNMPEVHVSYRLHDRSVSEQRCALQRHEARRACEAAWRRRGVTATFEAGGMWRPGNDARSRHEFALRYGWWAAGSREWRTAIAYGCHAIRLRPLDRRGWRLVACALLRRSGGKG